MIKIGPKAGNCFGHSFSPLKSAYFKNAPFRIDLGKTVFPPGTGVIYECFFNSAGHAVIVKLLAPNHHLLKCTIYPQLSDNYQRDLEFVRRKNVPYSVVTFEGRKRIERHYLANGAMQGQEITKGDKTEHIANGERSKSIMIGNHDGVLLCKLGMVEGEQVVELKDLRPEKMFEGNIPNLPGVAIGRRVSIHSFEDGVTLPERFTGPVELALPYDVSAYQQIRNRLTELSAIMAASDLEIKSVHAVQAPITEESFLKWGEETLTFADQVGARVVTVHPNSVSKEQKMSAQERALAYMRTLQARHQAEFAVETFVSKKKVFSWFDLSNKEIPVVLDTAHLSFGQSKQLIEKAAGRIKTVHLSASGPFGHHLPIDPNCLQLLRLLRNAGQPLPEGIILEYLPAFEPLYETDLARLKQS